MPASPLQGLGWAGAEGDGCSHRNLGLPLYRKKEKGREASSPCPGSVCGTPSPGPAAKKTWEQTPLCMGCAGWVPKRGALRGTGVAVQLGHGHRCKPAAAEPRLSSRAAHACGGEHCLLRLGNGSAACAAKSLSFSAECRNPSHQSRVSSPTSFPPSSLCGTINLLRGDALCGSWWKGWAGAWGRGFSPVDVYFHGGPQPQRAGRL